MNRLPDLTLEGGLSDLLSLQRMRQSFVRTKNKSVFTGEGEGHGVTLSSLS